MVINEAFNALTLQIISFCSIEYWLWLAEKHFTQNGNKIVDIQKVLVQWAESSRVLWRGWVRFDSKCMSSQCFWWLGVSCDGRDCATSWRHVRLITPWVNWTLSYEYRKYLFTGILGPYFPLTCRQTTVFLHPALCRCCIWWSWNVSYWFTIQVELWMRHTPVTLLKLSICSIQTW